MLVNRVPMRWPATWKDPALVDCLKGSVINHLLLEKGDGYGSIAERAGREGIGLSDAGSIPAGVILVSGEWPGVRLSDSGNPDRASAGPTGVPWVDSNGWKIRLTQALHPGSVVWVDVAPQKARLTADSYLLGVADAAAHGGRWILSLDPELAAGIAGRKPSGMETWKQVAGAAGFFAARNEWADYIPSAVIGIVSDFSGNNEFMSHELLNLIARTNQQYRIILKTAVSESSFDGLRAVVYADEDPPSKELRDQILDFVRSGGMLISGPMWGPPTGMTASLEEHPRYQIRGFGKGKVAIAEPDLEDPYLVANDSVTLISRRHELLRFWNGGAVGSYFTMARERRRAVVHLLFYASLYWSGLPSVRVAGVYRRAYLWTLDQQVARDVEMEVQNNAVELHMPRLSVYAALELEAGGNG